MKYREFVEEVKGMISDSCDRLGYVGVEVDVDQPPNPSYGDLASAVPIRVAKGSSENPGDVAVRIASEAMGRVKSSKYVGGVTPHRGGYVNFSINYPRFIVDTIASVTAQADFGQGKSTGSTTAVEHTNVNPNKALHIGHARNLVLGDSLVRVLRYLGEDVQALNYIDDSGAQVADIVVGFKFMGFSDVPPTGVKFDVYCGDSVYAKVNEAYASDPSLKQKQSQVLQEIEKGEGEIAEYTKSIVSRILAAQLTTCWKLGASYDLLNWESQLVHSGMWQTIFESLKKTGFVQYETEGENKGCWVIPDPETGEQKVVVRSDGTAVYVAKDIPYAAWKIGLVPDPFGYEAYAREQPGGARLYTTTLAGSSEKVKFGGAKRAISVIDTRQSYLQKIVAKVLEKIEPGASKRYLHRGYEVVALSKKTASQLGFKIEGEFAHMSGRKGLYANVDAVLDALKKRAVEETRKRNLQDAPDWVDDVAEAVSIGALRYELVKQDPDKMIVFDLDESLRFEGDTGPYLMYTYARARRILDKTGGRPKIDLQSAAKLVKTQERTLAKRLSMLDIAVEKAHEYLSPKEVAKFAHELAVAFNDFYESVQVNRETDEELRDARLALVDAASRVLAKSMELIGLPYRERI